MPRDSEKKSAATPCRTRMLNVHVFCCCCRRPCWNGTWFCSPTLRHHVMYPSHVKIVSTFFHNLFKLCPKQCVRPRDSTAHAADIEWISFSHISLPCVVLLCSVSFTSKFVCGSVNRFFHLSSCRVMALNGPYKTQHITFVTVATSKMQREQKKTTKQNRSPKLLLLFTWICLFTALQRQT